MIAKISVRNFLFDAFSNNQNKVDEGEGHSIPNRDMNSIQNKFKVLFYIFFS